MGCPAWLRSGLAILAWVGAVACDSPGANGGLREAHRRADAATTLEQKRTAVTLLEAALDEVDVDNAAANCWVRQDGAYRIASLQLDLGAIELAAKKVAAALSLCEDVTLPRANLLELKGRVLELQQRPQAAVEAYSEAMDVNERLLRESLGSDVGK